MTRRYFGTDGVRGPYGGPLINEAFAERLGFAAARWLLESAVVGTATRPTVLIGRDTRASGAALEAAVAAGLYAGGAQPVSLGILPTPAVSRAVGKAGARLGVMITASHNPAADNGIKFFAARGVKLTDADEAAIEQLLPANPPAQATDRDRLHAASGRASEDYVLATTAILPPGALQGWRIVLDTANGATCGTSPMALRRLGAEIISVGEQPDGTNINAGVGSEHPEQLAAMVREQHARIGVAHDGDGDRCVLCDELGKVLDGDEILTILATHALAHERLPHRLLVVTKQSNLGVDAALQAAGGRVLRTDIGDRYVIERMMAEHALLGGESSGHVISTDVSWTGDGLVTALKTIEVMLATGEPLSRLRERLKKFPQRTSGLRVKEKRPLETLPTVSRVIAELERSLGSQGRLLVRYSGTEPKLRLLVEGPTDALVGDALARLEAAVRVDLEVV